MSKSPAHTLTCKQCSYVNEPERVYCHNCGQKLDRSVLPKEGEIRRESPERAQKRIRKMTNPGGGAATREVKAFLQTMVWAVVAAAVIQIVKPPDDVPDPKGGIPLRLVSSELAQLVEGTQPRAMAFDEVEMNYLLKTAIKAKDSAVPGVTFDRAFINFRPGFARVTVQQGIWGYPLYAGIGFKPQYNNGVFRPEMVSGNIGRLPVHPKAMEYVSYAFPFRNLWTAMKRERDQIQKLREIRPEDKRVVLVSRGGAAVGTPTTPAPAAPATTPPAATSALTTQP